MRRLYKIVVLITTAFFMIHCSSDDETKLETSPTGLTAKQLEGTWMVSYFWDQSIRTDEYLGYIFTFKDDSSFKVDVGSVSIVGSYDIWKDSTNTVIDLYFNDASSSDINDKLRELTENWIVKSIAINNNSIEFEERESDNPPEILHLTRL